jgi:ABC-type nitrate/sulfonate/bicarbonate transport system substrate-binding protein
VSAADLTRFKVGISEPVNTVLAIWMAEAAGFYAGEGLAVEIANMSGGSRGTAELAAGRLDAMHVGLSSVVRLNRSGADLRIVAALANVIRFTFFASPGVATPAQLRGGVVGVSTFGSESETVAALALERLGLGRADVTLQEFGGSARRLAALKSGEIAATALNEPAASLAREQGLRVLIDLVPERIPWLFTGIAVRREAIGHGSGPLVRFLKAVAEGNALARSDAARGKAVLAKGAGIGDPKIVDVAYEDFRALSPPEIEPTRAAAENVLAQFPDASRNLSDYIDTSVLDGLKRDGVFAALRQKYG